MNRNLLSIVVGFIALFVFGASFALGQIDNVHVGIDEASNVANNWISYSTQALNNRLHPPAFTGTELNVFITNQAGS